MTEVYGAIRNVITNEQLFWDSESVEHVLNDIKTLSGNTYGEHWIYAGDIGLEEGNIFVADNSTEYTFDSTNAIEEFVAIFDR